MSRIHIHQIYHSEETRIQLDAGFIALDNLANERPDWREYWVIRNFLLKNQLCDNDYYGFFSPKFKIKTNLDSNTVFDFIRNQPDSTEVILFSPFFDQSALYQNIFEQGINQHKGFIETFKDAVEIIAPEVRLQNLISDSRNTVFCNYFVAKPAFWKEWFKRCELLFHVAEVGNTKLSQQLNSDAPYGKLKVPAKVFVIERIASLLLATQPAWEAKAYNLLPLPLDPFFAGFRFELLCLDALKIAYTTQGYPEHKDAFIFLRHQITQKSREK